MGVFLESLIESFKLIFYLDKEVLSITLLSFKVSLTAVILASLIAIPLALLISNKVFGAKKILISIIHTGMALPPVVVGLIVYMFLSRNGLLGYLDLLYTPKAMIIAQIIIVFPIIIGISLSALNSVKKKIRETAITLGATKFQYAMKTIKEAKQGIVTAVITAFGRAIGEVGAIIIVGGNIRFHTRALTTAIVLETRRGEFAIAMALGIILIGLAFLINFTLTHIQQKKVELWTYSK
ncbi:MAG: ABC transporter permease [Nanoarchaeota archaeon]|nr:ABC transporter permease [Nanoarchaeota archaeon]MBU1321941.1 ABC transporter permease [Nanoarchaeota archaeon]MBU1597937.1 ABC transporter permease [Nanoarchaeota archaeon]MBU2441174.1 ABC transporter permease [Nanoarchaeota archaeon]